MIQANELRIGNWIHHTPTVTNFKVLAIAPDEDTSIVEPIPLTEEILLKCGFEKEFDRWKINYDKHSGYNSTMNTVLEIQRQRIYDFCVFMNGELLVIIKNTHELQNLFYSLSKKELTITL